MSLEHLHTDNPEAIAFGRARLAALRAAGQRYVTQVFDTPFGRVKVRIVGGVEYIYAEAPGNLYLVFWAPGPAVTPAKVATAGATTAGSAASKGDPRTAAPSAKGDPRAAAPSARGELRTGEARAK